MSYTRPLHERLTTLLRNLFIATCVSAVMGCQSLTAPLPERPPLPANLTAPCLPLTPLEDGTGAAVLRKLVEVSGAYYDCAARHGSLSDAVR